MKPIILTLAALCVSCPFASNAVDMNGRLEWEWAYSTAQHRQQKNQLQLELEFNHELDGAYLTAITRLKADGLGYLLGSEQSSQSQFNRGLEWSGNAEFSLRELYFDFDLIQAQWRVGKQQQVWGQADGLKVLDRVNPQDFSEFILDEFEDSRIPLWMLAAETPVGESAALQLLWIPDTSYHRLTAQDSDFDLLAKAREQGLVLRSQKPKGLVKDSDVGLRYSDFIKGWDVSLNYLYHYNDFPSQVVRQHGEETFIDARYDRNHLLGASASNAFGDITLRAELGVNSHQYYATQNQAVPGVTKSSELSSVFGVDWHGFSDTLLSVQWFQSTLLEHDSGIHRDKTENTLSFLLDRKFSNETISFRSIVLHSINQADGLVRSTLKFNVSNNIDVWFGADFFYGDEGDLYGQFDQQDRVLFGLELGF